MLKRKIYDKFIEWKEMPERKALMVLGARQVGKTYAIRQFGKNEYQDFIEINFIKNPEYKDIFDGNLDADSIYRKMSAMIKNMKSNSDDMLIFLDEIQVCGNARTALKFLVEDGRYDIIASGSLLGLNYAEDGDEQVENPASIPVGYETYLTMYSLDFEEFLWAEGYGGEAIEVLKEYFENIEKIPKVINDKFEQLFREYIIVGGMPEVVNDYANNHDFTRVDKIQQRILRDYRFDISKHAKGAEKVKVNKCYDSIPVQLARELKKFKYSTVEKGQTRKKYGGSVQWLVDSSLVHPCYNVINAELPLVANAREDQFKLYINDTGLLMAMYGYDTKLAVMQNKIKGNAKGGIYENIIAESLVKQGYKLYYYKPDDSNELEFIIEKNGEIVPIEVKAGNNATVSLNTFVEKYKSQLAYKLVTGNIGKNEEKVTIPHYMVLFI